jgi:hypothetical protein
MKDKNQIKCLKNGQPKKEKVKVKILKLVLGAPRTVKEHDVVTYLIDSKTIKCQSSVNRHFNDLCEMECLNKIGSKSSINLNKWNVTKFETLRKIKDKFPEIDLNKYEKSITIVLKESGYSINSTKGLEFYMRLYLSVSFFNICLETDIDTLCNRAWNVYLHDSGFETNRRIKKLLNEFYYTYAKNNPNFKMSNETFQEVVKEIEQKGNIGSEYTFFGSTLDPASYFFMGKFKGLEKIMSRAMFMELENEATLRTDKSPTRRCKWNNTYDEEDKKIHEINFLKICEERFQKSNVWGEMSLETFLKTMNEDRKLHIKMNEILSLLKKQHEAFHKSGFGLQLKHFLNHDIFIGANVDEEFEKKVEVIESKYDNSVGLPYSGEQMYNRIVLEIASEFILKYKQPKFLYKSDDKVEILQNLLKVYDLELF